jgi:DNA-binding NtrC family response regulator
MKILKNLESKNYKILGSHPEIIEIHKIIGRLSKNRLPVLIEGEPGTGKHQVARILHQACCPDKELVTIDCSTIIPILLEKEFFGVGKTLNSGMEMISQQGILSYAGDGMVLLDEVSALPLSFQWKFLKAIQHNEFSTLTNDHFISSKARIVATTQYDLRTLTKNEKFREDLYYYLASSRVVLPPLRKRKTDIPLIVHSLIVKICRDLKVDTTSITQSAMQVLMTQDWPGNIEELEYTLLGIIKSSHGKTLEKKNITASLNSSGEYMRGH